MQHPIYQRSGFTFPGCAALLTIILFIVSTVNAEKFVVSSQSGNSPIRYCDNAKSIWHECSEFGCPGVWRQLSQLPQGCLQVGKECADVQPVYVCRKVSGSYRNWDAKNAMLDAYFATNYCWFDLIWFFSGSWASYDWTALRGTKGGGWINIEFKTSSDCSRL